MKTLKAFLLVLVLLILLSACSDQRSEQVDYWETIRVESGNTIRIAVVYAESAEIVGPTGGELARGAQLAVSQFGNIRGFDVEIVEYISNCNASQATGVAQQIATDPAIIATIGFVCSLECEAAAPVLMEGDIPLVSPGCSTSNLTDELLRTDTFFRTMYDDILEARLSARYVYNELGIRYAATISDGTQETNGLVSAFTAEFASLGGVVSVSVTTDPRGSSIDETLPELLESGASLIYAPLMTKAGAQLIEAMAREPQFATIKLLGGRHYWNQWIVNQTLGWAEGVYAAGPIPADTFMPDLSQNYREQFDIVPNGETYAFAYDAMWLVLKAIDGTSVVGQDRDLLIGRRRLYDNLSSTGNFQGATGTLTCTEWGDCSSGQLAIGRVQNGTWQIVYMERTP
nr:branched-chain amino acid ABC transporter substrate-binding protein [Anaerolineae bacterium]